VPLTHFTVTGKIQAVISDSADAGGDPDLQNVSCTVWFRPSVRQVHSSVDGVVYRLADIRARTNIDDGQLKTIDGSAVSLPANTAVLGLPELRYRVDFEDIVYNREAEPLIESFEFIAPTSATTVDFSTVQRFPV
jgi:hypothetical protein